MTFYNLPLYDFSTCAVVGLLPLRRAVVQGWNRVGRPTPAHSDGVEKAPSSAHLWCGRRFASQVGFGGILPSAPQTVRQWAIPRG